MFRHDDWPWVRITGALGVSFFVVFAVALLLFIGTQPSPTDPIAEIEDFFANDASVVHSANWLAGSSLLFLFLPFAAGLGILLTQRDLDAGMWARSAYGAATALVAITAVGTVVLGSAMLAADTGGLDADVMRLLLWADALIYSVVAALAIALFLATVSILILRTAMLRPWLGWLGLAVALVCMIGAWWPIDGDPDGVLAGLAFLSLPLLAIWSLLAGIYLLRTPAANAHVSTVATG